MFFSYHYPPKTMYALWHLCAHAYMTTCSHVSAAAHVQQHGRCARQQTFRSPVNEHLCGKMTAWRKSVDVVVLVRRHELNITHEGALRRHGDGRKKHLHQND